MKPTRQLVEKFADELHGSGVDADWHITETKQSFRASNSFHLMDEYGGYIAWVDFTVIFPKNKDMEDFKLQFAGDMNYYVQRYMLRDYLEDTIYYTIERAME